MKKHEPGFAERRDASSQAKQALLDKAKARANDPQAMQRAEARRQAAVEREARLATAQKAARDRKYAARKARR